MKQHPHQPTKQAYRQNKDRARRGSVLWPGIDNPADEIACAQAIRAESDEDRNNTRLNRLAVQASLTGSICKIPAGWDDEVSEKQSASDEAIHSALRPKPEKLQRHSALMPASLHVCNVERRLSFCQLGLMLQAVGILAGVAFWHFAMLSSLSQYAGSLSESYFIPKSIFFSREHVVGAALATAGALVIICSAALGVLEYGLILGTFLIVLDVVIGARLALAYLRRKRTGP